MEPIFKEIESHPFNKEMEAGSLSAARFQYYLSQDSLYLIEFSRLLSRLASKLSDPIQIQKVLTLAQSSLSFEKSLHDKRVGKVAMGQNPASTAYTNFLWRVANEGTAGELAAALLPCYWIYLKLGLAIKPRIKKPHAYFDWIEMYSSSTYQAEVQVVLDLVDTLATKASKSDLNQWLSHTETASRYEWYFWDAAYNWTNSAKPGAP
jgi:thiaminase/transcriptional activator TenA